MFPGSYKSVGILMETQYKVYGILDCRFGGPHTYFGEVIDKPFIGENERTLNLADMQKAIRVNRSTETMAIMILILIYCL